MQVCAFSPSCLAAIINQSCLGVRQDRYAVEQPVFFGAADKDYICIPDAQKPALAEHCKNLTIKHYDGDHWLIFSHHKEINEDVLSWLDSLLL
jgi:soluble epoxide hydrolase/lipid-phosphate phosphatase